ncbi:hypothetical protein PHYSODRAFT_301415 [Phytophthora sojae]|uniref:DUF7726 domain-containing protein n=1 Tax=Phytophthora sojae (strain P6497) TaxID=1094619 RepID=G4ZD33_PHYSP|nr:hypothetical protein PHYSODRAFT_301415 [Phytophthora sojae]EGZ18981.1 hypothetical protein PHYSODRAFT_301415 [Phytophthora sojae]|eukprot:XP_009528039.1 hypothetical protein PHYSODRAFT_301415 [Phytophthora sojae]
MLPYFGVTPTANALANRPPEPLQFPQEHIENEFDAVNPEWRQWSCRDVRLKIRSFLGSSQMTQAAFLKVIDVDASLYRRFMALKGPDEGDSNPTYKGAAIFFSRREQQEKKEEAMKRTQHTSRSDEREESVTRKKRAVNAKKRKAPTREEKEEKTKKTRDGKELLRRIEAVKLPNLNENGCVPVYDDCDEVRRKINVFLGEGLVTKATFLRALGNVNSNSLRRFMSLRGAGAGAANEAYRKAFAFFEKKRILDGEEKTAERLKNEYMQGPEGFPRFGVSEYCIDRYIESRKKELEKEGSGKSSPCSAS